MIIVCRKDVSETELDEVRGTIEARGLRTHVSRGDHRVIVGCIGEESAIQEGALLALPGVESVTAVLKPYKLAAREFVAESTVVHVGDGRGGRVGGEELAVIAGPCSVEGRGMLLETAWAVRAEVAGRRVGRPATREVAA